MSAAIDTSILVYAHVAAFAEHDACRRALEAELSDPEGRVVLTVGILHEWMHVVTDGRRFEEPLTMDEAARTAREYLGRQNISVLSTEEVDLANALTLVERYRLGRQRLADALLAATLRRHGVRRLMTRNRRDFQVFPFLEVVDPLGDAGPG